ncbi:MAG: GDSL-type esterase/lipase family protein [Acidobacteriaceae bacterium]|nr:GDSL-type esterase/lipase family protein [Acidobacteriaceae bacterium]
MRLATLLLIASTLSATAQTKAPEVHESQYVKMREAQKADPSLRLSDYAGLGFYADANAALAAPKPGAPPRVLFFGDSITHNWGNKNYSDLFQRKSNYINRGIGGQTTGQMLLRYRDDVLALQPKVVVLLGGTNDLASYKLPDVAAFIEGNIQSLVELMQLHGERVILCSLTPVSDAIKPQTDRRDPAKILALNAWLKQYAAAKHIPFVDYYDAVTDGHDRIQTALTIDGLHPNHDGVAKMEPLVEAAIAAELKK